MLRIAVLSIAFIPRLLAVDAPQKPLVLHTEGPAIEHAIRNGPHIFNSVHSAVRQWVQDPILHLENNANDAAGLFSPAQRLELFPDHCSGENASLSWLGQSKVS